jgi:adenylylsulfate kinase
VSAPDTAPDAAVGEAAGERRHRREIVWHNASVTREMRERLNSHRSAVIWFTGLSGSGKSTLAHTVEARLHGQGCRTYVFDGDNVRHGLCADLGFSPAERSENIRRIGEMSKLFLDAGVVALTAFISPYHKDRHFVRELVGEANFVEIYVRCPLAVCESRDIKGLYRRARAGQIKDFTGISAPYEEPQHADLILDTDQATVEECVNRIMQFLAERGIARPVEAVAKR